MLIGHKGTSKNAGAYYNGTTNDPAHGSNDPSSVMTDKSFFIAACKLRAKPAQRVTLYCLRPVFRGALETNSQPTASAKPPVSWPERLFRSIRQNGQF